jgi:hypothetical protein
VGRYPSTRGKGAQAAQHLRQRELEASKPGPVTTRFVCPLCEGPHAKLDCQDLPAAERVVLLAKKTGPKLEREARIRRVVALRGEGKTIREIAEIVGVSTYTISKDVHLGANMHQRVAVRPAT